jgi:hydrogenase-4 component E
VKNPQSALIIILIVSNFYLLSSSRLRALIRIAAFQGMTLGLSAFLSHAGHFSLHTVIIGAGGIALKGIVIPLLLFRALRGVEDYRESKPYVSYPSSIIAGILITVAAFWTGTMIPASAFFPSPQLIALAIAIAATGLFLIVTRKQVLTQIIGYLVLENAVYTFGISLPAQQSVLVEMGALLDLLVGIFIMGVVVYHINKEFDSITTDSLEELKE